MNRLEDPCYYCGPPKRTPTCHGTCPFYKVAKEIKERDRKARKNEILERTSTSNTWNYEKRGK